MTGNEATSSDARHKTANRIIPFSYDNEEQTMGGIPWHQSVRDFSDYLKMAKILL